MASANIEMLKRTGNNENSDECYTPKEAIIPLLEFLPKDNVYYECTSGKSSSFVDVMTDEGYVVYPSLDRDFLTEELPYGVDIIVSNPPYSKKDAFIRRCYELEKPFALLLPVSSIQGKARGKMFTQKGIELLILNDRIDFTGKGSPHFGVAYYCWNILPYPLIFKDACYE